MNEKTLEEELDLLDRLVNERGLTPDSDAFRHPIAKMLAHQIAMADLQVKAARESLVLTKATIAHLVNPTP